MNGYTKQDVSRIAGLTPRAVHYWVEQGLVVPSVDSSRGKGATWKYSEFDIIDFAIIKMLRDDGFSLKHCQIIIKETRKMKSVYGNGSVNGFIKVALANNITVLINFGPCIEKVESHIEAWCRGSIS